MTGIPPLVCPADSLPPLGVDRGRKALRTIFSIIIGGVFGALIVLSAKHALEFDLLFLAGWLFAIALHEIAHATAAYARGWYVASIVIGPIYVTRSAGHGWRLGFRPVPLGGMVYAGPRRWEGDDRFRRDVFWFVGAGPTVSFATGAIAFMLGAPKTMLWCWGIISLVIGVGTIIPARYPTGLTSDGDKLLRAWRSEPGDMPLTALRMMAVAIRPRDWDPTLLAVARAEAESEGSDAIDATFLLYYWALDCGDIVGAGALLQRAIDYTCGTARWPRTTISLEVGLEATLYESVWRGDAAAAREWVGRAPFVAKSKSARFLSDFLERKPAAIAKFARTTFCHRATIERLNSSSSG